MLIKSSIRPRGPMRMRMPLRILRASSRNDGAAQREEVFIAQAAGRGT